MRGYQLCYMENNTAYFYRGEIKDIDTRRWMWHRPMNTNLCIPPVYLPRGKVISVTFIPPLRSIFPEGISPGYINQSRHPWMTVCTKSGTKFIFPGITVKEFEEKIVEMGGAIGEKCDEGYDVQDYAYSDPHFNHKNIIGTTGRPFSDVLTMNHELLMKFNAVVTPGDRTYFLGDVGFGNVSEYIQAMNGYKILIMGNHDRDRNRDYWLHAGFHEVVNHPMIIRKSIILSHEPMPVSPNGPYFNIHGHLHQSPSPSKMHLNVSVEKTGYKPILISRYKKIKKQEENSL